MTSNKVALITGAGSGIGRAIAIQLFKDGYSLVLAGRRRDALEETIKLADAEADSVLAFPTDVAKAEDVGA
jgi:NADP-dependent 3-hydroxy acid dehydrogenase YdfG